MKQIILIHGRPDSDEFTNSNIPSPSNAHWFPWLQKQLIMNDILCQAPEFPFHNEILEYDEWKSILQKFTQDSDVVLVGHSTGAGFILRYLSEGAGSIPEKVVLVAPYIDPKREDGSGFFDFEINNDLSHRTSFHIFSSSDDMDSIIESCKVLQDKLPGAVWHNLTDRGHFCDKDFPELLDVLM